MTAPYEPAYGPDTIVWLDMPEDMPEHEREEHRQWMLRQALGSNPIGFMGQHPVAQAIRAGAQVRTRTIPADGEEE